VGYLKSRVFETRLATLDELMASIREAIHGVLQRVTDDFTERITAKGGTFTAFCF
jgi:hypothetical protein